MDMQCVWVYLSMYICLYVIICVCMIVCICVWIYGITLSWKFLGIYSFKDRNNFRVNYDLSWEGSFIFLFRILYYFLNGKIQLDNSNPFNYYSKYLRRIIYESSQNHFSVLDLLLKFLTINISKHYYWNLFLDVPVHLFFYQIKNNCIEWDKMWCFGLHLHYIKSNLISILFCLFWNRV